MYLFRVNNGITRIMFKTCSKLRKKTPEWRHWRRPEIYTVYFEQISYIVLIFPFHCCFEQVNTGCVSTYIAGVFENQFFLLLIFLVEVVLVICSSILAKLCCIGRCSLLVQTKAKKTWHNIFVFRFSKNISIGRKAEFIWDKVFKNGPSRICERQP